MFTANVIKITCICTVVIAQQFTSISGEGNDAKTVQEIKDSLLKLVEQSKFLENYNTTHHDGELDENNSEEQLKSTVHKMKEESLAIEEKIKLFKQLPKFDKFEDVFYLHSIRQYSHKVTIEISKRLHTFIQSVPGDRSWFSDVHFTISKLTEIHPVLRYIEYKVLSKFNATEISCEANLDDKADQLFEVLTRLSQTIKDFEYSYRSTKGHPNVYFIKPVNELPIEILRYQKEVCQLSNNVTLIKFVEFQRKITTAINNSIKLLRGISHNETSDVDTKQHLELVMELLEESEDVVEHKMQLIFAKNKDNPEFSEICINAIKEGNIDLATGIYRVFDSARVWRLEEYMRIVRAAYDGVFNFYKVDNFIHANWEGNKSPQKAILGYKALLEKMNETKESDNAENLVTVAFRLKSHADGREPEYSDMLEGLLPSALRLVAFDEVTLKNVVLEDVFLRVPDNDYKSQGESKSIVKINEWSFESAWFVEFSEDDKTGYFYVRNTDNNEYLYAMEINNDRPERMLFTRRLTDEEKDAKPREFLWWVKLVDDSRVQLLNAAFKEPLAPSEYYAKRKSVMFHWKDEYDTKNISLWEVQGHKVLKQNWLINWF